LQPSLDLAQTPTSTIRNHGLMAPIKYLRVAAHLHQIA